MIMVWVDGMDRVRRQITRTYIGLKEGSYESQVLSSATYSASLSSENRIIECPITVKVKRRWHWAKVRFYRKLNSYREHEQFPSGLCVDVYA